MKLDDRPWGQEVSLRFEVVVLGFFVLMAVLMAATGAPKYETNSNHEIEGVHPQLKPTPRLRQGRGGAPGTWGAWLHSDV